jgi:hypothetical protein
VAKVIFTESAFRHGYTEYDYYELLESRYRKTRSHRGLDAAYELLGRNRNGDYLHIVYRILSDGRFLVFHMARMTPPQRRRYQKKA